MLIVHRGALQTQDADGKRRAARAGRKTAAQDKSKKKASAAAPTATQAALSPSSRPLHEMLPTILEADFFINRTTFASIHTSNATAQRYYPSYWDDDCDYVDDNILFGIDMKYRDDLWDEAKRESDEFVASMEDALVQYMRQWNLRTHAQLAAHDAMPDGVKVQAAKLLTRV